MNDWIQNYIEAQHRALDSVPAAAIALGIETVRTAWQANRHIFIIGNGGSAANASHFATDLGKGASDKTGKRFRVLSLADNVSWLTALGNDYHFDDCFVRQLENFAEPGDLLIACSVSGNSPNVVKAMAWAKENGLRTLALVGGKRGKLATLAEQAIVVEDSHFGRAEDVHMHVLHMICYSFMENQTS
jgi:D-sedoheptulose 7-phosphate isomerase